MTRKTPALALALSGLLLLTACGGAVPTGANSETDLGPVTNECGWNNPATAAPGTPCFP